MNVKRIVSVLVLLMSVVGSAHAEEPKTFGAMLEHYEKVRLALVVDDAGSVNKEAMAIAEQAQELFGDFTAEKAGVPAADAEKGKEIVGEIATAAAKVAEASDLASVRDAFFELSKPMGRYRKLTGDMSTIVAYCPMVKKAWLQPEGDLGNPYLGQEMPNCGNRIPD